MTLYSLLLRIGGLSHREAAAYHGVRPDTVKSWSAGRNPVPAGVIAEIRDLIRCQRRAADELLGIIEAAPAGAVIELGIAADDRVAQAPPLGWPCVSAQAQTVGMAAAMTDRTVVIVPRGSTTATVPDLEDLRGSAPDATGDLSSEAFVRKTRDDWM